MWRREIREALKIRADELKAKLINSKCLVESYGLKERIEEINTACELLGCYTVVKSLDRIYKDKEMELRNVQY